MRFSNRFSWSAAMIVSSLAGMLAGCPFTNSNHCALMAGACGDGLVCDRCAVANNGCVDADELTKESCLVENSGTSTEGTTTLSGSTASTTVMTEPTTTTTTTTTTTSSTTQTGLTTESDTSTTGGFTCDPSKPVSPLCNQANPEKPYCVAMDTCGSCSDLKEGTCAEINGDTPACDPDHGMCVECTADNTTNCGSELVCNTYKNDCGDCFEHEQCPNSACDIKVGKCFNPDFVVWVEESQGCTPNNSIGSEDNPYCFVTSALENEYNQEKPQPIVVWVKPSGESYPAPQQINLEIAGIKVAVIGIGEKKSRLGVKNGDPRINLDTNATLYMSNVELVDPISPAANYFECAGESYLHLDQVRMADLTNPIKSEGCEVTLNRTLITNTKGGSSINGSKFTMVNSIVSSNSDVSKFGGPFKLSNGVKVSMTHVTFVNNSGQNNTGLICADGTASLTIRNSVLLGDPAPVFGCDDVKAVGTMLETNGALWKTLFQSSEMGVFRPKSGAEEIETLATWQVDDPYIDYDGKLRPNEADSTDFAGACRP